MHIRSLKVTEIYFRIAVYDIKHNFVVRIGPSWYSVVYCFVNVNEIVKNLTHEVNKPSKSQICDNKA